MKKAFDLIGALRDCPELYSQENVSDPIVRAKFFTPFSSFSWFVTEYSPVAPDGTPNLAFGLVQSHMEPEGELGYISLQELLDLKSPFGGPGVERDLYFEPCRLSQALK